MTFTPEKLAALRARFAEEDAAATEDPRFGRTLSRIIRGGRRPAPYAGVPSFLAAPLRQPDEATLGALAVALYGMPMDLGVTNRTGARFGPRALRAIERIGPWSHVHDLLPLHDWAVADVGDVPFRSRFLLEESHADIEAFVARIVAAGALPLGVGGDHSVTHPVLRAVGRDRPVGLVHIDAHCDTSGTYDQSRFHHGAPFRNAVLDGVLDPERTIQIGIRGSSGFLWEFSHVSGMRVVEAQEIDEKGLPAIIAAARAVVGDGPCYLSFDIDSLDPAFAPGTGTPEAGGLSVREALALLRGLRGLAFVGGDVVEVAPQYDATTNTAQAGAQVLFEILCLLCLSPARGNRPGPA